MLPYLCWSYISLSGRDSVPNPIHCLVFHSAIFFATNTMLQVCRYFDSKYSNELHILVPLLRPFVTSTRHVTSTESNLPCFKCKQKVPLIFLPKNYNFLEQILPWVLHWSIFTSTSQGPIVNFRLYPHNLQFLPPSFPFILHTSALQFWL